MKKIFAIALVAAMAMNMMSCNEKSNAAMGPMTDSVSIGFAEMLGKAFNAQSRMDSTLDKDAFIKGMKAALNADTAQSYMAGMQMGLQLVGQIQQWQKDGIGFDANTFMTRFVKEFKADSVATQQEIQNLQNNFQMLVMRAQKAARENNPKYIENKKAGEAYVNKKAAEAGYKKTESGIVYKVITEGAGENFTDGQNILTKYKGMHIDGKVFDESQEPVAFNTKGVIAGFAEILKLMKPGMKVEVIIPSELAYGADGSQNPMTGEMTIEPNETLVFEMETVGVQPEKQPTK